MSGESPAPARRRRLRWWVVAAAVLVVVAGFLVYGFVETYRLEVEEMDFTSGDVPVEFDGTRIALLTDIHRCGFFSQARVRRLVERVNSLQSDLIVLGGDYVYGSTDYEASCFEELSRLQAPLGRFAVLGNHDYGVYDDGGAGLTPAVQAIQSAGLALLYDRGVWLEKDGARIRLGGVGDFQEDEPSLAPVLAGTAENDFVVLVSHNPDYAEELPVGAVDLMLSGHTHGGQVTFFDMWAPHVPSEYGQKYRSGLVITEATTVIVSKGVGTIFPPVRFFARPQIVVVTLHSGVIARLHP